jgi:hypothetical protein
MTGMTPRNRQRLPTRRVVIGGAEYDKPWDPSCGACRSPWLGSIDASLAEGYSIRSIRKLLAGRHPAVPNDVIIRAHIEHLAEPHRKARLAFEEAAAARGDDTTSSGARMEDALRELLRQGTERMAAGELDIAARDMIAAMKLQIQLDRARDGEGVEASAWQAAFMSFFEIVRRHLGYEQWKLFVEEVYADPAIRAVLEDPQAALQGRPGG